MTDANAILREYFAADYRIERELSGGGMSQVVLAMDLKHQRRVVIKLLPQSLSAVISAERFEREIMVSAALQHPNIVPVLSSGRLQGLPYFVMPFIEGESVRTRVRRGPLSVRECVSILKDVTRALVFAHAQGVIHRDIKPDNVLLSTGAGAAAVVTDFGVAKAFTAARTTGASKPSGMTGVGMSIGTPGYMAPEQAAADPSVDHRADIYALGILGYEMLAGAPPFHGRSPQELLAAQMTEAPAPLELRRYDLPKALNDLLMRCLEKSPAKRPQTAAALLRQLEQPEIVSGAFAVPTGARGRAWRTAAIYAGALALLFVAGEVGHQFFQPLFIELQRPQISLQEGDRFLGVFGHLQQGAGGDRFFFFQIGPPGFNLLLVGLSLGNHWRECVGHRRIHGKSDGDCRETRHNSLHRK